MNVNCSSGFVQEALNVLLIAPLTQIFDCLLWRFLFKLEVPLARVLGRYRSADGSDRLAAAAARSPVA